jgi:uncharacterized DUF497 family protein
VVELQVKGVDFDQLRRENLDKDAVNLDELREENLSKGIDFDQLRRENLDKDAVDFDELRRENLDKDAMPVPKPVSPTTPNSQPQRPARSSSNR